MTETRTKKQRPWMDACAVLLALALAAGLGVAALRDWQGPAGSLSNDLYVPAALWAAGAGFIHTAPAAVPGLEPFLRFEHSSWIPPEKGWPPDALPLDANQAWHRYLVGAAALAWKMGGLEWDAIKALIVALYCVSGVLVYLLFRMVSGPVLALLGTALFLGSPATLATLPNLRDFSKAPFLLGALWLYGLLLRGRLRPGGFIAAAAGLALLQGVGVGFRRDVLMYAAPSLGLLALAPVASQRNTILLRLGAVCLYLALFLGSAYPILDSFRTHGTLGYHDTLMGMATRHDDQLGLRRASYERVYLHSDSFVADSAYSYAERATTLLEEKPAVYTTPEHKRAWLLAFARTFPADMLARAGAAVLAVAGGAPNRTYYGGPFLFDVPAALARVSWWLAVPAWACAALVLLGTAARSLRRGLLLALLAAYVCGMLALQWDPRHALHLGWVQFWSISALASWLAFRLWRRGKQADTEREPVRWGSALLRIVVFAALAAGLTAGAWRAALAWQQKAVDKLVTAYAEVSTQRLDTVRRPLGDWTLAALEDTATAQPCAPPPEGHNEHTACLVAEFEAAPEPPVVWLQYETPSGNGDFSRWVYMQPPDSDYAGPLRYFFPVYEIFEKAAWTRFAGLALPPGNEDTLLGLSRVAREDVPPLLLNLSLPEDPAAFRAYQRPAALPVKRPDTAPPVRLAPDLVERARNARAQLNAGALEEAAATCREGLAADPGNLALTWILAETHAAADEDQDAVLVARAGVRKHPNAFAAYATLWTATTRLEPIDAFLVWDEVAEEQPKSCMAWYWFGRTCARAGQPQKAAACYKKALEIAPEDEALRAAIGEAQKNTAATPSR